MTTTPNINLKKPEGTEFYDLAIVNENSDTIDAEITDAKAGSALRVFKVKSSTADADALNVVTGKSLFLEKYLADGKTPRITANNTETTIGNGATHTKGISITNSSASRIKDDGAKVRLLDEADNTNLLSRVVPVGTIIDFAGATAPAGFLVLSETTYLRADYPDLFNAIGTLWGATNGRTPTTSDRFYIPPQTADGLGLYTRGKGTALVVGSYQSDQFKAHTHDASHNHTASSASNGGHSHTANHNHTATFSGSIMGNHSHPFLSINYVSQGTGTVGVDVPGIRNAQHATSKNTSSASAGRPYGSVSVATKNFSTSTVSSHTHTITVNTKTMNTGSTGNATETRPRSITVLKCIKY